MKKLIWSLLFTAVLTSCSKDDEALEPVKEKSSENKENVDVQDFIFRAMDSWYLYEAEVPELANDYFSTDEGQYEFLASFDKPEDLFEGLQASHDDFSFMWDNYEELEQLLHEGVDKTNGMIYSLYWRDDSKTELVGLVRYVLPNSSAEEQGIKRGNAFTTIDGQTLTGSNYKELLAADSYDVHIAEIGQDGLSETGKIVNLVQVQAAEDPVFRTEVLELEGKKIGYLMYNGFTSAFDAELNNAFGELKAAGVDELVVDLRYNGGGSIKTAVDLASMITGQFKGKLFAQMMLNRKWQKIYEEQAPDALLYDFDSKIESGEMINSLNLDQVYVLTTGSSASASELLINGLQAYIDVVHIGTRTAGKFQGSRTLYDSPDDFFSDENINPDHTYAIQPLISKVANANGVSDYAEGLMPDIEVKEIPGNYGVLGDASETMLRAAINDILGYPQEAVSTKRQIEDGFRLFGGSGMMKPTYQRMYHMDLPLLHKDRL